MGRVDIYPLCSAVTRVKERIYAQQIEKSMLSILPLNAIVAGLRAKADVIALAGVIAMCLKS